MRVIENSYSGRKKNNKTNKSSLVVTATLTFFLTKIEFKHRKTQGTDTVAVSIYLFDIKLIRFPPGINHKL